MLNLFPSPAYAGQRSEKQYAGPAGQRRRDVRKRRKERKITGQLKMARLRTGMLRLDTGLSEQSGIRLIIQKMRKIF